jgi:hypothetical protein
VLLRRRDRYAQTLRNIAALERELRIGEPPRDAFWDRVKSPWRTDWIPPEAFKTEWLEVLEDG